jgi:hypothetical protein
MTPKHAWSAIIDYIPTNKIIWSPFYGDGKQKEHFKELGFDIIHEPGDFFETNKGDIIIDNPPFGKKKEVFIRLKELDKPFIILCPSSMINTQYIRNYYKKQNLQLIIPRKRIHFFKQINNEVIKTNKCNFDCFYYCYKMNLPENIIWLD